MKKIVTLLAIASAIVGCDKPAPPPSATTDAAVMGADNTKMNDRDRGASTTPLDQGNGKADLDVTQAIRKALMADDSLSTTAKNVKVVTNKGVITLRGPVKSDAEKKSVEAKASAAAAGNRVDNQLDIDAK